MINIHHLFYTKFIEKQLKNSKATFSDISDKSGEEDTKADIAIIYNGQEKNISGIGNGPIDSFKKALAASSLINVKIIDYTEHAMSTGSEAKAASYVYMERQDNGNKSFGVGVDSNITRASVKSMMSAINRLYKEK